VAVKVLFFAQSADWAGRRSARRTLSAPTTLQSFLDHELFAGLRGKLKGVRFAVNHEFVDRSAPVADGDEVAVLPPVSGG